jgi:hypothetical protein
LNVTTRLGASTISSPIDRISVFLGQRFDKIVFCEGHRSKVPKKWRGGRKTVELLIVSTYCFYKIFVKEIIFSKSLNVFSITVTAPVTPL